MDGVEVVLAAAVVVVAVASKQRRKRKMWQREFLSRRECGRVLTSEILLDSDLFSNFARMSKTDFEILIELVGPRVCKKETNMRPSIPVATRVAIVLRFLATGDSFRSLMYTFRVHYTTISQIVPDVLQALMEGLKEFIKLPSTEQEWKCVADDYKNLWNFPHCVGSMDGKHIAIECPPNSGSKYYNYKQFFSIVLFAVVDANYKFMYVNVGCQGRISDGGVFRHTSFGQSLLNGSLGLPPPEPLPGRDMSIPFVFLADDAFPLTENIMKPYTVDLRIGSIKRVCNYRISRGRRIVENAFGLLASVFRVLHTPISLKLETTRMVVMTCTMLHNFLRRNRVAQNLYSPSGILDFEDIHTGDILLGSWRNNAGPLTQLQNIPRNANQRAKAIRDEFMHYFMTPQGRVPWQDVYLGEEN